MKNHHKISNITEQMPDPIKEAQKIISDNPSKFTNDVLTKTILTVALFEYGKRLLEWYKGEDIKIY